ncbi:unnamed protein product [Closterium sp. NIES-65]|nr:unnamed protein product [Closterium sp. NIES-65]
MRDKEYWACCTPPWRDVEEPSFDMSSPPPPPPTTPTPVSTLPPTSPPSPSFPSPSSLIHISSMFLPCAMLCSNGGWVMHDEACAHYTDMVHQMAMGHRFLMATFNVTPRIAWQIDPFGHSATQASLITAQAGLEAVFMGRVDQQEKESRLAAKTMEFVWRADGATQRENQVLGMVSYDGYYSPSQFRYQDSDDPSYRIQVLPRSLCCSALAPLLQRTCPSAATHLPLCCNALAPLLQRTCPSAATHLPLCCSALASLLHSKLHDNPYGGSPNVQRLVDEFVAEVTKRAEGFKTNHLLFPMGEDFAFDRAILWFKNMDKLIHYVNLDGRVNALYSTPSMYLDALHSANATWPLKTGDMFPYQDDGPYCSGYFRGETHCPHMFSRSPLVPHSPPSLPPTLSLPSAHAPLAPATRTTGPTGPATSHEDPSPHIFPRPPTPPSSPSMRSSPQLPGRRALLVRLLQQPPLSEAPRALLQRLLLVRCPLQPAHLMWCGVATTAAEAAVGKEALQAWGMATGRMMVLEHLVLDTHMGKTTRDSQKEEKQADGGESAGGVERMRVGWESERRVRVASSFRLEEAVAVEAVAVVQHHDGITGTAQQHVTDDYSALLHRIAEEVRDECMGRGISRADSSTGAPHHARDPPPSPSVPPSNLSSNLSSRAAAAVEFTFREDSVEQRGWGFWNQLADGAEEGDEEDEEDEGDEEGKARNKIDRMNELLYEADRAGAADDEDEGMRRRAREMVGSMLQVPSAQHLLLPSTETPLQPDQTLVVVAFNPLMRCLKSTSSVSYWPTRLHLSHPSILIPQVVVAFNPLAWSRSEVIRFPVSSPYLLVTDASGAPIPSQKLQETLLSPPSVPPVSSPNLLVADASGAPIPSQIIRETLVTPATRSTYIAAYTGVGENSRRGGGGGGRGGRGGEGGEEGAEEGEEGDEEEGRGGGGRRRSGWDYGDGRGPQPSHKPKRKHRERQTKEETGGEQKEGEQKEESRRRESRRRGSSGRESRRESSSSSSSSSRQCCRLCRAAEKQPGKAGRGRNTRGAEDGGARWTGGRVERWGEERERGGEQGERKQEGVAWRWWGNGGGQDGWGRRRGRGKGEGGGLERGVILLCWRGARRGGHSGSGAAWCWHGRWGSGLRCVSRSPSQRWACSRMELVSRSANGTEEVVVSGVARGEIVRMGMAVSASMMEYATFAGGAYIFQPSKPAMPITSTNATYQVPIHIQRGPIVEEFSRQITPWISEVFRVYPGGDYAELHYS